MIREEALLRRAAALPVARAYPRPIVTQSNPTTCGPASLVNVAASRGVSLSEREIARLVPWSVAGYCPLGVGLRRLAGVALACGLGPVEQVPSPTLEQLRHALRATNREPERWIANFDRSVLFGRGPGHHSPVAGYLEDEDLALVLDVGPRFGPWLTSSADLHRALSRPDRITRQPRGLLRLHT